MPLPRRMPRAPVHRPGYSLFCGATAYGVTAAAVITAPPYSLACWFLTSSNGGILTQYSAGDANRSGWETNAGKLGMYYHGSHNLAAASTVTNGVFRHGVLVVDAAGSGQHYLDGKADGNSAGGFTGNWANVAAAVGDFGGSGNLLPFTGTICALRIWSRALSAAEVLALYLGQRVPAGPLLAEWLFGEGSGSSAADTSGNGRTLTLTNATFSANVPIRAI